MLFTLAVVLFGASTALGAAPSYASRLPESTIEPTLTEIEGTAATASPLAPLSNVKGIAFDRFFQVWLENTVRISILMGGLYKPAGNACC
jgi:acid phosphatase